MPSRPLPSNFPTPIIPPSLLHHAISPSKWHANHPRLTRLCVGALIFRLNPLTQTPQILLIQRASTDFFPNLWEIPGGSVEATDSTLLDAVVREVWEETGLLLKGFKAQAWDFKVGEKRVVRELGRDGSGKEVEREVVVGAEAGEGEVEFLGGKGEVWCKLNFVVDIGDVGDQKVVLDEEEHQDWGWFGRQDIFGNGEVGTRMRREFVSEQALRIVERGFELFEKGNL